MNKTINEIKVLSIDMISNAKSGHPGMALGSATMMYTLFNNFLNIYNKDSEWTDRDRFVLSSGHASSLLYSILHMSGFNLEIEDLKRFRQINSITPGHPEYKHTDGVEATTGPLGQGVAMAVGMAFAEKILSEKYNKEDLKIIDHYTYTLCGDGDMQEGVLNEAISFAGHMNLNKLIILYDNNDVTLDGPLSNSSSDNIEKRFISSNWNVIRIDDGENIDQIIRSIKKAKKSDKPTLIIYKTIIGNGSLNQGSYITHGNYLKDDDVKQLKEKLNLENKNFYVSEESYLDFKENLFKRSKRKYNKWKKDLKLYKEKYEDQYNDFMISINNSFNLESLNDYSLSDSISTRMASNKILNTLSSKNNFLIGGSADVSKSVMTTINDSPFVSKNNFKGKNISFGVREFAMASISNGITLHKGFKVFIGSFLVFSDYMKPAIRLSSIMNLPLIYLFSHDSIAVGEDGPTHQPIEHMAMLRSIPNLITLRPGNEKETINSYIYALNKNSPVAIVLTRQDIENIYDSNYNEFIKGAYFIIEDIKAKYNLIATGSEVNLAIKVANKLREEDIYINVVSMPSMELFENQKEEYKNKITKDINFNISLEMLSTFGWSRYAKHNIGIDTFGDSGKAKDVIEKHNFDIDGVYKKIKNIIVNKDHF